MTLINTVRWLCDSLQFDQSVLDNITTMDIFSYDSPNGELNDTTMDQFSHDSNFELNDMTMDQFSHDSPNANTTEHLLYDKEVDQSPNALISMANNDIYESKYKIIWLVNLKILLS